MKKNLLAKIIALLLIVAMLAGCAAQGNGDSDADNTTSGSVTDNGASDNANDESYVIGANIFGTGAYPFDKLSSWYQKICDVIGDEYMYIDDQYTSDRIYEDVQSLIAAEVDGVIAGFQFDQAYESLVPLLDDAGVYFSGTEEPSTDEIMQICYDSEYFLGVTSMDNRAAGREIAELAVADGMETCIIISQPAGSVNGALRIEGFREVFEEAGGVIYDVAYCIDSADAVTKGEDLFLTYSDVDMILATGSEFAMGAISVLERYPDAATQVYGVEIDSTVVEALNNGSMRAACGDDWMYCFFSCILLEHYLHTGEKVVDENGNAYFFRVPSSVLTPEQTALWDEFYTNGCPYTDEEIRYLVFEATADEIYDTIMNYSFEERMVAKYEEGSITLDELTAAGFSA